MAEGVLDQVSERLLDPQRIELGGRVGGSVNPDLPSGLLSAPDEPLTDPLEQRPELHPLASDRQAPLIRSCDHEQVLGQLGEPIDLLGRRAERGSQLLGRALLADGELELSAEDRERPPELVAGVGDEDPLPLERGLDPVEHLVEGRSELVDLVIGPRQRQPLAAALQGDLPRPPPHRLDRRQRPAREQVAEAAGK